MTTQTRTLAIRTALYAVPTSLALAFGLTMAAPTSSGKLITLNAPTSGTVRIVTTAKGSELQIRNLKTEPGPGLKVWLFAGKAPVKGTADSEIAKGKYLELGELKTFSGNFKFAIPAGTNVADYSSVVLWCGNVSTAFGAAALK